VLRVTQSARALEPSDGELTELRLGESEIAVEIVELLLEALQPIEVLFR
jgi:hypothetical protein